MLGEAEGETEQKKGYSKEKTRQKIRRLLAIEYLQTGGTDSQEKRQRHRKKYTTKQMVAKLRRLADYLENGKQFQIQIAGERIKIPAKASFNIEHEREGNTEEVEFQFKWEQ